MQNCPDITILNSLFSHNSMPWLDVPGLKNLEVPSTHDSPFSILIF